MARMSSGGRDDRVVGLYSAAILFSWTDQVSYFGQRSVAERTRAVFLS